MPNTVEQPEIAGQVDRLVGHAMDHGWIPHKPATWAYRFASLREPLVMRHFTGKHVRDEKGNLEPEFREVPLAAGHRVKIVMVSRFGDVGITEELDRETGYGARVELDRLCDFGVAG